jgi:endonuclease/exonuclease/phosphatase family metal-dependent hydrolase
MDGAVDLHRTARTMRETRADVIALQEVDRLTARTGGLDEPAILGDLTGLTVAFWPTLRLEGGHFGIALAARGDMETRFEALDNAGVGRPHGVVVATVRGVLVMGTHLSTEPAARAAEGRDLLTLVRDARGPLVVAGDLNQSRRHLGAFGAAGLLGDGRLHPTHPSLFPMRQIDHVLAGGGARVEKSWTVKSLASDHLALVADVEIDQASG